MYIVLYSARQGKTFEAVSIVQGLCASGYAATDVIQTLFKVVRGMDMPEAEKLEYIREIGFTHMRISEGLNTSLQISGCVARLATQSQRKISV